jgi:hypothetical protein
MIYSTKTAMAPSAWWHTVKGRESSNIKTEQFLKLVLKPEHMKSSITVPSP